MKKLFPLIGLILLFWATPLCAQTPHSVTITFTASVTVPSGASGIGYNLYRGTTSEGESSTPLNAAPYLCSTNCQFINGLNLVEGTTYYYYIKTVDLTSNEESPASAEVSATIPVTIVIPLPPTNPKAVAK